MTHFKEQIQQLTYLIVLLAGYPASLYRSPLENNVLVLKGSCVKRLLNANVSSYRKYKFVILYFSKESDKKVE